MATACINPSHIVAKTKGKTGSSDRETRAFVALQHRKISRQNGLVKKRGVLSKEIYNNENEVANSQNQHVNKGHTDPIKNALKKWQKNKRQIEMKSKQTKKQPFCSASRVSYKLSEYSHSHLNGNTTNSSQTKAKLKNMVNNSTNIPPLQEKQLNKTKLSKPSRDMKTGSRSVIKRTAPSSTSTMATRSMSKKAISSNNFHSTVFPSVKSITTKSVHSSINRNEDCSTKSKITNKEMKKKNCQVKQPITANRNDKTANQSRIPTKQKHPVPQIPKHFSFTVPASVQSFSYCADKFQFTQLSPASASKFFPTENASNEGFSEKLKQTKNSLTKETKTNVEMTDVSGDGKNEEICTNYFRDLANSEINRLKSHCLSWECFGEKDSGTPEEVKGKIRTVIGQVHLLATKKFKQFNGLLDLSEDPDAERKTLVSDLQGFWDMMYIQVKDIDKKFSELEDLKKNNWIEKQVDIKKVVKKRSSAKKAVSGSKMSTNKTDESRNKFREMRTRMKAKIDAERRDEENAFKIILTPVKNKAAIGSNEPETILTPVRRSTRKSRNDINAADPLRNLPANVSVDLFGSTSKTGQRIIKNEYLTNLDDSVFGGLSSPVPHSVEEDLMIFSPKTTGNTNMKAVDESNASLYL